MDEFSQRYLDLLEGQYDCPDRIVLNAYYPMGHSPGGFRTWWRELHGDDESLDNAHLMRMAGRLSRRLRAYAEKHSIPVIQCEHEQRKHKIAEQHLPQDPDFVGLFLVLVGRAPAPVWNVRRTKKGAIQDLSRKQPYPYVNHYYFHLMDPDWGHVTLRMSGHPPFPVQIILNGHEYVAQQARHLGLNFAKEGNCFTVVADAEQLAQIADTLRSANVVGQLRQVCERWLYSTCLYFALPPEEQERSGFRYQYSVYQVEYSRNLLFQRGFQMEQLFQTLIDRTRVRLDVKRLKTIFGAKRRPFHRRSHQPPREEIVIERPQYDLTVFKIHFGQLTLKLYTKGERVLRCEVIVHNTKALRSKRQLEHFPYLVEELRQILIRFLNQLHGIDQCFIDDGTLDTLAEPGAVGQTRTAGIDLAKPRMRTVLEAIVALAVSPQGFKVAALAAKVRELRGLDEDAYRPRHASYDLKKLRGKNWVRPIGNSRRYETLPDGLRAMTALLVLREKVIKPVLAGAGKPKRGPKPKHETPLDLQYHTLHTEMRTLFHLLGVAV